MSASEPPAGPGPARDQDPVEPAGRFRVYLGAAAGVGKTYAMLNEGERRRGRGADVAVAFVECHGRPLTERLLEGLEVIPRKVIEYRGSRLAEMDLEAVLRRRPGIALIDELAHTNVPGSGPHDKRWQDVLDILAAGIDVITTVNIQHLESIADEVENMTGAPVRERVPDWVVRKADQIELVDSSPEQLRRRMLHGNIYPPERVQQALTHFFRTDNLTALRELALRFLADETDDELLAHLRRYESTGIWETAERIMAAVTAAGTKSTTTTRSGRSSTSRPGTRSRRSSSAPAHATGGSSSPGAVPTSAGSSGQPDRLGSTCMSSPGKKGPWPRRLDRASQSARHRPARARPRARAG